VVDVELTDQQMHFFYFKNALKFTLKYTQISLLHVCHRPSSGSLHWTWL